MTRTADLSSASRLLIAALAIACVLLVLFQLTGIGTGVIASKLIASTLFVAIALRSGALQSTYGRIILVALIFSWSGDVFLLGTTQEYFLAGLASFLLGHVAYVVAFSVRGLNARWSASAFLPVAVISILVSLWLAPHLPDSMVIPVRAYTFVISLMVVTAFGAKGAGGPLLIPLGATLFYFSDLSVAAGQFLEPGFPNYVWGLPFYYTGQLLLALSTGKPYHRYSESSR